MKTWLRTLFASEPPARPPAHFRLGTEALEQREVPASSFDPISGMITVIGTEAADRIEVTRVSSSQGAEFDRIDVRVNNVVELSQRLYRYFGRGEFGSWVQIVTGLNIDARGGHDGPLSGIADKGVWNNTNLPSTLNGGWGDDYLVGGTGKDTLFGWYGNDILDGREGEDVLVGGSGNDVLHGGWGNATDVLWGRNGGPEHDNGILASGEQDNDTLYGLDGNDYLNGNVGDDRLYGYTGNDTLVGGPGDDRLYGEQDNDSLYGEGGKDGLFGGIGTNWLYGGGDADRFLIWTAGTSNVMDRGVGGSDADVKFEDNLTASYAGISYAGKAWTEGEIQAVDDALAILHREGRGAELLRPTAAPRGVVFDRHSGWKRASNDGSVIHFSDRQMDQGNNFLVGNALHEIAHYWNVAGMGEPNETAFLAESEWTQADPNDPAFTRVTTESGQVWWYKTASGFASSYAKSGPDEDFAESFAAYFLSRDGRAWYTDDDLGGASAIPGKLTMIGRWVAGL